MEDVRRVSDMAAVRGKWAAKGRTELRTRITELELENAELAAALRGLFELLCDNGVVRKDALAKKLAAALEGIAPKRDSATLERLLSRLGLTDGK